MNPTVSAVIPTTGRRSLRAAVRSARLQAGVDVETVVVVDGNHGAVVDATTRRHVDVLVTTGGKKGAGHARNRGVAVATGEWVAFLDDDDYWLPEKSSCQLSTIARMGRPAAVLASCQVSLEWARGDKRLHAPVPRRVITENERVEDYLFRARGLSPRRNAIFTSTILTSNALAASVGWNEALRRHQDWDFALRAQRAGAAIVQVEVPLVVQRTGSRGSISASTDWRASHDWARSWEGSWSERTLTDFLFGQTLRHCLADHAYRDAAGVCADALRRARPSTGSVLLAASGLLPRQFLEDAAARLHRQAAATGPVGGPGLVSPLTDR